MESDAKTFEMWWPGRELNPRRQPFQGCALPPELPGHFRPHSSVHKATDGHSGRGAFARSTCALTGQDAAKQNSRCAWDRAELSNYNNGEPFAQNRREDFSLRLFVLACSLTSFLACFRTSFALRERATRHAIHDGKRTAVGA